MERKQITELQNIMHTNVEFDISLKKHTTFGIGGIASCFAKPKTKNELKKLLKLAHKNKIETIFMGSGSNVLAHDRGFDGIIITLKNTFKNLIIHDNNILAESGVMLGTMVKKALKYNFSGLESLIGVPGTIGGAIKMNAGAYGSEISNLLHSIIIIDQRGNEKTYLKDDILFDYRKSNIKNNHIIVSAFFECKIGNKKNILKKRSDYSNKRKRTQPLKFRSAGSVFKNPSSSIAAGYLIDQAGLKGLEIGNAKISEKHANFIVNLGNASSYDILKIIKIIKYEIYKKFKIKLELEIKLIGFNKKELNEIQN